MLCIDIYPRILFTKKRLAFIEGPAKTWQARANKPYLSFICHIMTIYTRIEEKEMPDLWGLNRALDTSSNFDL